MKTVGIAICLFVLCICVTSDSYSEVDSSEGSIADIKRIACLPFSGEKIYRDYATSTFWKELNKSGCIELVSFEKVRDEVSKNDINVDKISDDDLTKLFKILDCDAIFVCHLKRIKIAFIVGNNFAIVKLLRKGDLKNIFSVETEGGALTTLTHESCIITAARKAAKKFIRYVKKNKK